MPDRRRVLTTASVLIVMMLLAGMSFCMTARQFQQAQRLRSQHPPRAPMQPVDSALTPHR